MEMQLGMRSNEDHALDAVSYTVVSSFSTITYIHYNIIPLGNQLAVIQKIPYMSSSLSVPFERQHARLHEVH